MIKAQINAEVSRCIDVLKSGGIILYPTDTVWGIGCDATNERAVEKIIALKNRPDEKSMIILLDHTARLPAYLNEVPRQAYELMELSEQPLTLVLDGAKNLAGNLVAKDGSIGVRIVQDEFCRRLIERLRKPLVSTSANVSGAGTPGNFSGVDERIKSGVDYIVALRQDERGVRQPSTVIQLKPGGVIKFLRK